MQSRKYEILYQTQNNIKSRGGLLISTCRLFVIPLKEQDKQQTAAKIDIKYRQMILCIYCAIIISILHKLLFIFCKRYFTIISTYTTEETII